MRIRSVDVNDAAMPNRLISSCRTTEAKRRILAGLRRNWKRCHYRLVITDNDGNVIGMAFADDDGHVADILSERDFSEMSAIIENAVSREVRHKKARKHQAGVTGTSVPAATDAIMATRHAVDDEYDDDFDMPIPNGEMDGISMAFSELTPVDDEATDMIADGSSQAQDIGTPKVAKGREKGGVATTLVALGTLMSLTLVAMVALTAFRVGPFANVADVIETRFVGRITGGNGDVTTNDAPPQISDAQTATLVISPGDTISSVTKELRRIGMPVVAGGLYDVMDKDGTLGMIQAGTYLLKGSESAEDVAVRIASGQAFPDGYLGVDDKMTVRGMSEKVAHGKYGFTAIDFMSAMTNVSLYKGSYKMLASAPDGLPSLEGFVSAGIYDLSSATSADGAVRMMLDAGERRFEESGMDADGWFKTLTMASMLDKEVMYDDEKPVIASVMDNRLARDMPLQIDATVLYALGRDTGIPTYDDLETDSPYNTYRDKGLPIGPICSGITQSSIDAVRSHDHTDFLYYCLKPENDGHHAFAVTYEEHQRNQQAYDEATGRQTNGT